MSTQDFLKNDAFLTMEVLALAVQSADIGVWKVIPRTRETELTAALKEMLGVPVDQPVDYATFLKLVHPDDLDDTRRRLTQALMSPEDCDFEFRIVRAGGDVRWLAARGRAYFEGKGKHRWPTLFIGTMRDVTATKSFESDLQSALEHQERLLHEVNHRVKNSLQLVSSLLRLQARGLPQGKGRQQIEDATTRISTIAHIHQRLYRDKDVSQLNFGAFLSELCSDLQGSAAHCSLHVQAPAFPVKTDRAVPLALIVTELVTNAFKYAYPDGGGRVAVLVDISGGHVAITVKDHGVGLPDGFTIKGSKSLGMVLIGSLIGQLGGKLDVRPTDGGGATFVVTAPSG